MKITTTGYCDWCDQWLRCTKAKCRQCGKLHRACDKCRLNREEVEWPLGEEGPAESVWISCPNVENTLKALEGDNDPPDRPAV